jgi:hypothetical protein
MALRHLGQTPAHPGGILRLVRGQAQDDALRGFGVKRRRSGP